MLPPRLLPRSPWRIVAPVVCFLLGLWPASLRAEEATAVPRQLTAEIQSVAQAVNQRRAEAGLPPLTLNPLLTLAAQNHVDDMIYNGAYGHVGSDGSYVGQRVQRVGYSSGGMASENWVSATSPDEAMTWWMNDWIHRVNILNPSWQEFGVGAGVAASGRIIFVTVFAAGNGAGGNITPVVALTNVQSAPSGSLNYVIQPGDTLIAIAVQYGVDWTMIAEENRLREDTLLQIGQQIRVPGVQNVGGAATVQPASSQSQAALFTSGVGGQDAYRVKAGDTLLGISLQYGLAWETLATANGLGEHDLLQIDQLITIPGTASPTKTGAQPSAPAPVADPLYYSIQPGDTILTVAIANGLDWKTLLALNGLTESSLLQIGQQIRLR